MSHTVDKGPYVRKMTNQVESVVELSALSASQDEDVAHGGPSGATVAEARMELITKPTDGSTFYMEHESAGDSTTNNTAQLRFMSETGGSLTGAKVRVTFVFTEAATGGTSYSVTGAASGSAA